VKVRLTFDSRPFALQRLPVVNISSYSASSIPFSYSWLPPLVLSCLPFLQFPSFVFNSLQPLSAKSRGWGWGNTSVSSMVRKSVPSVLRFSCRCRSLVSATCGLFFSSPLSVPFVFNLLQPLLPNHPGGGTSASSSHTYLTTATMERTICARRYRSSRTLHET
jgi:hypothetical protein